MIAMLNLFWIWSMTTDYLSRLIRESMIFFILF